MKSIRLSVKAIGLLALALGPVPVVLGHMTGSDVAYADSSNSKGNSGGNGGGNSQGGNGNDNGKAEGKKGADNGKGSLASELKGMNAVHANPKALENADPNSQVGKIAAYRDAALVTQTAEKAVETAEAALAAAAAALTAAEAMPISTPEEIAARDAAIEAASAAVETAKAELEAAAAAEDAALLLATGGDVLSDEALAYIRGELGL